MIYLFIPSTSSGLVQESDTDLSVYPVPQGLPGLQFTVIESVSVVCCMFVEA